MPPILMHDGIEKHGEPLTTSSPQRLWLFSGTGDGPALAVQLLHQGWALRVSVVSPEAACAYGVHPRLELLVGPLGGSAELLLQLQRARDQLWPFRAVIDATHPFAVQIRRELVEGCHQAGLPLLALARGDAGTAAAASIHWLDQLADLSAWSLEGEQLLFAIGARFLPQAIRLTPGAVHHARVLPQPTAMRQALVAGVAAQRIACLRPTRKASDDSVEAALVRRWNIGTIVARASGPPTETLWRQVAERQHCRLLLVRRPQPPLGARLLEQAELLQELASWLQPVAPGGHGTCADG